MTSRATERTRPAGAGSPTWRSWAGASCVASVLAALGLALSRSTSMAVAVLALAALVFLQSLSWRTLVALLIGATFVTRFRVELFGIRFLPEHVVLAGCVVSMVVRGRRAALARAASHRASMLLGLFVAWSGVVSMLRSPDVGSSLEVTGWLALDWLLLVVLVGSGHDQRALARWGVHWLGIAATVAVGLWILAAADLTEAGVQVDTTVDGLAAYGLSFEANILASSLALWVFVALTTARTVPVRARGLIVVMAGLGIGVALTRAAVVGMVLGLLAWAVVEGRVGRRLALRTFLLVAVAVSMMSVTAPGVTAPILAKGGQLLNFGSGNGQLRVSESTKAIKDLQGSDWLVGLGTNSFGQRHLDPTRPGKNVPSYLGNLPLQVVYDTGAVGAFLLVAALITVFPRDRTRAARAVGLLVLYMACAIATSPLWFGTTWVLVAMAVIDQRRHQRQHAESPTTVGFADRRIVSGGPGAPGVCVPGAGPATVRTQRPPLVR